MSAFDRILGYAAIKAELRQISDILRDSAPYEKLGVTAPRGLLIYGPPGVGKSLMAGCIIEESGRRALLCRKDAPNGDFVKKIKATFAQAVQSAPAIVYLDDLDKFANEDVEHPDAEEYVTVQSCMDEVKDKRVFVLATANNMDCLPESLCRAGRFDHKIEVNAPCGREAEKIIAHFLESKHIASEVRCSTIAKMLNGSSCAELESIINTAGLYAGAERAERITMRHFNQAYVRSRFAFPYEDDAEDTPEYKKRMLEAAYHEAGHAVVSEVLRPESVTFITAYSQGGESGGFTHFYNDHRMPQLAWKMGDIVTALGGMAAAEQKFGLYDIGAARDLRSAFFMTEELVEEDCVSGFQLHASMDASEALKREQELAVSAEIEKYYRKAKEILARNGEFFEKLAAAIAEKKLLTEEDVQTIKRACSMIPVSI